MDDGWLSFLANWDGTLSLMLRSVGLYGWAHRKMLGRSPARLVEFMSDEAELHSQHPISELFAPDNEVHGLWMSGTGVIPSNREHLEKHKIIRSLVLPRPDNPALAKLIERLGPSAGYYTDMPEKIRTTTALGKALGAEVRWHDGEVTGIHVTIVNPERENGWAHITIRLPFVEPGKFWAMRLERRRQTDEFGRLWRAYEALRRPSARQ